MKQLRADAFSMSTGLAAFFFHGGFRSCQDLVPATKMHQVAVTSSLTQEMTRPQPQRLKGRKTLCQQPFTVSLPTSARRSFALRVSGSGVEGRDVLEVPATYFCLQHTSAVGGGGIESSSFIRSSCFRGAGLARSLELPSKPAAEQQSTH